VWNTYRSTREFQPGQPWLLRFFDQIRFFPVSEKELLDFRQAFLSGRAQLKIQDDVFSFAHYRRFLREHETEIAAFRKKQQTAFAEERERWAADGSADITTSEPAAAAAPDEIVPPLNGQLVASPITGNVWAVLAKEGDRVAAGQKVVVVEAMKMEVGVESPIAGVVRKIAVTPGKMVTAGQALASIEQEATP
jgi:urea carboxylase